MKRKQNALTENANLDDLLVDLTFHDMPAALLTEFAEKIVRPYYHDNLNQALKDLMEKAITEQDFIQKRLKPAFP